MTEPTPVSVVTPARYVQYLRCEESFPDLSSLDGVVMCYQRSLLHRLVGAEKTRPMHDEPDFPSESLHLEEFHLLDRTGSTVAVALPFGIGAPVATIVVELLHALGVRTFISMGTAGALQPDLVDGEFALCNRAIRGEGVSRHYVKESRYAKPSPTLTAAFARELDAHGLEHRTGTVWTTDTPFREMHRELRTRRREDVLAVDMEAAALFAVARRRALDVAAAFVISDSVAGPVWQPHFRADRTEDGLDRLFDAAVATLRAPR